MQQETSMREKHRDCSDCRFLVRKGEDGPIVATITERGRAERYAGLCRRLYDDAYTVVRKTSARCKRKEGGQ